MLPQAYVSHSSKGRLRFRVPSKKSDLAYFSTLHQTFEEYDFIHQLEVNPSTGSVLVLHSEDTDTVLSCGKKHLLFESIQEKAEPKSEQAQGFASSATNPHSVLIKSLIGLGMVQVLRGEVLAPASTLFMDAYRLYLHSKGQVPPQAQDSQAQDSQAQEGQAQEGQ